ncbi:DUF6790 family protein [uncultured Gimesia sp.]|uniref:DUF6790 family protein n=1 Tax=uncultured Gimesia sp. TaxID=1678688 RepID=UPI0030DB4344
MNTLIPLLLENFTLTFLILGLLVSGISLLVKSRPRSAAVIVEALFSYFLLFSIGFSFFSNFIMHSFFGKMIAGFIGWEQSPFQFEVGTASLGYAVVGFLAFKGSLGMRAAAVIGPSLFLLGAAAGHVYQMIMAHNFAPGNAGVIFYTDLAIPIMGFVLLGLQYRYNKKPAVE